jgi:tetratricopeptide (TPR) repeat protein
MRAEQVVEIYHPTPGEQEGGHYCSGYLISPALALTCEHGLVEEDDGYLVRALVGGDARHAGRVCWRSADLDLALLRLATLCAVDVAPPMFAAINVNAEPMSCRAVGFPLANVEAEKKRFDSHDLGAEIRPAGAVKSGVLLLNTNTRSPEQDAWRLEDIRELWQGMSGAAVFVGPPQMRQLVGVIQKVPPNFGGGVLHAARVAAAFKDRDFVEQLKLAGVEDQTPLPQASELPYRLVDYKQGRLDRDPADFGPSELLQARYGITPFVDPNGAREEFLAWCVNPARTAAGRLVHAPGGLGKTRLLIEVCASLRAQGWMAGFLEPPPSAREDEIRLREQELEQMFGHGEEPGLLLALDYAEGRQSELRWLAERLDPRRRKGVRPIRLVLLTRSAGVWWEDLHDKFDEIRRLFRRDARTADVVELEHVAAGQARLELFDATVRAFAPMTQAMAEAGAFPRHDGRKPDPARLARLSSNPAFARPLAIQMEALLHLASAAPTLDEAGVGILPTLLDEVLGLEHKHWGALGALGEAREGDLRRGVAQVTAVGGAPTRPAAQGLLMRDGYYKREVPDQIRPVLDGLTLVYANSSSGIRPLEPDLLGEHEIAGTADDLLTRACLEWIAAQPESERQSPRRRLLTVLQRATLAEHGPHRIAQAEERLGWLVRHFGAELAEDITSVMVETPGALSRVVEGALDDLDLLTLRALDLALPQMHLCFLELALEVSRRHAALAKEVVASAGNANTFPDAHQLAHSVCAQAANMYGVRLSALGRHEEALEATAEAVAIYRALAKDRPDAFLTDLAASLNNMGAMLSALDRREEALEATAEAMAIYRTPAKDRPDAFLPYLAASLNNMGLMISALGRREEALEATAEAVAIYRALAKDRPDAFLPDLAVSLNNMGGDLSALGRREEALEATAEAVTIRRALAKDRPDAFLPDLATSLNNMGMMLSALGRREEALEAIAVAVAIRRTLAKDRPDAFLPALARSLETMGQVLAAQGRHMIAAEVTREGLALIAPFVERLPDAFGNLAQALAQVYLEQCKAANIPPDGALIERVVKALRRR